ncbi:MAG: LbtU family siderophore porin [Deltaproteobacteria bacterium]|nr:LbtU family siderophore porin [Deltaproteobacteria bacterium]
MKKQLPLTLWLVGVIFFAGLIALPGPAWALDPQVEALIKEVQALKTRVADLEKKLVDAQCASDEANKAAQEARQTSANSLKVSQELSKTVKAQPEGLLSEAAKRINVYGAVEVEASYQRYRPKTGQDTNTSDITLSTAEIFFEANINEWTRGLIHLLYEQGETDPLNVDEGFILLGQTPDVPYYLLAGRMYPSIGLFQTYMVSDPITQEVFETQATAAQVGWAQDWFNVGVGGYNAAVHENSDDPDYMINTWYTRLQFDAPEGALGEAVDVNAGVAYTNNIAGGNLSEEVPGERIHELVGGWSVMVDGRYHWVAMTAEYLAALDDFQAGELYFIEGRAARPEAWNFEVAFLPWEDWTFACRYEGGSDLGTLMPERQYGATVSWAFLTDTTLSLEYLHGEYDNDDERDLITTQLAVGF